MPSYALHRQHLIDKLRRDEPDLVIGPRILSELDFLEREGLVLTDEEFEALRAAGKPIPTLPSWDVADAQANPFLARLRGLAPGRGARTLDRRA